MSRRSTAYLNLLLVSMIWGAAPAVIKFTLHDFPPLLFLTYRFLISSVIALAWIFLTKSKIPHAPGQKKYIFWYSMIGVTVGLGLLFFGIDKTTSLTGNILTSLGPLSLVFAAAYILHERVTNHERIGISIAFIGALLIILLPLFGGTRAELVGALEGNLLIILAIIADAAAAILAKICMRNRVSATLLAHLSFLIGFLTIAPIALFVHGTDIINLAITAPLSAHLGVWFMAIFSGTIAYSLRNRAVRSIEVSETAPFTYLHPLWGAPLSILWLGESLSMPFIIGAVIIGIGVIFAEYKGRKHPVARRTRHT